MRGNSAAIPSNAGLVHFSGFDSMIGKEASIETQRVSSNQGRGVSWGAPGTSGNERFHLVGEVEKDIRSYMIYISDGAAGVLKAQPPPSNENWRQKLVRNVTTTAAAALASALYLSLDEQIWAPYSKSKFLVSSPNYKLNSVTDEPVPKDGKKLCEYTIVPLRLEPYMFTGGTLLLDDKGTPIQIKTPGIVLDSVQAKRGKVRMMKITETVGQLGPSVFPNIIEVNIETESGRHIDLKITYHLNPFSQQQKQPEEDLPLALQ